MNFSRVHIATMDNKTKRKKNHKQQLPTQKDRERLEGLGGFLNTYRQKLKQIRAQLVRKQSKPVVLLNLDGPAFLKIPRHDSFVMRSVAPSNVLFDQKPDYSTRFNTILADHIWYLREQSPSFLQRMSLLDPVGDGSCGYICLQLFQIFLEDRLEHNICEYLVDNLTADINYFKSSPILVIPNPNPNPNSNPNPNRDAAYTRCR
jgi:hypothetical protein